MLDKDIHGAYHYSRETTTALSASVNKIFRSHKTSKYGYGTSPSGNGFQVKINRFGKFDNFGTFKTSRRANVVAITERHRYLYNVARMYAIDPDQRKLMESYADNEHMQHMIYHNENVW